VPNLASKPIVFCDFDGPIVDVSDRYYSTYCLGLREVNEIYQSRQIFLPLKPLSQETFWYLKQQRVPDVEIALRSGLRNEQIDLFLRFVKKFVNQPALLHQDCLQPGVRWALELLHAHGLRLVLVTLRCQTQVAHLLHEYGFDHLFSSVRGTQEEESAYINSIERKTRLLQDAWDTYCQHPKQCPRAWMVGDTEADILAGRAVGITTVALTCGIRSHSYLAQFKPTCIQTDLLTTAHALVGTSHPSLQAS